MRVNALMTPTMRAVLPLMVTLTVISQIQQMCQCLDDIQEVVEWITTVEEMVIAQVNALNDVPDPIVSNSDRENFDYNGNLD